MSRRTWPPWRLITREGTIELHRGDSTVPLRTWVDAPLGQELARIYCDILNIVQEEIPI